MSSPYNDPTSNFHDRPTQKLRRAPRSVSSLSHQRKALQEQRETLFAWEPVALFLVVFVGYGMLGCYLAKHINEVLYVLLMWSR